MRHRRPGGPAYRLHIAANLPPLSASVALAPLLASATLAALRASTAHADQPTTAQEFGRAAFINSRDPPSYRPLAGAERDRFDLGHAIFNTHFVPAGMPNAARRDGLGPLFNSSACDACHNEGAHGRGPTNDGRLPESIVVELSAPGSSLAHPQGDPRYGRTFNPNSLDGQIPEGVASVKYTERSGQFHDGQSWSLRVPQYQFSELHYGPLASDTIIQPRIAPALFGLGLLEQVSGAEHGRFGWQNTAISLVDQTAQALSRDMGLTSPLLAHDDCTPVEKECLAALNGGTPEVSQEFLDALVTFQGNLAVPSDPNMPAASDAAAPTARAGAVASVRTAGEALFGRLGCAACHTPTQSVSITGLGAQTIRPYSDLELHDMGTDLADRNVSGRPMPTAFRTAPLWGMAYRLKIEHFPTFLHDGRARSLSEAILWHGGEASSSQARFAAASAAERGELLEWLSSL